MIIDIDTQLLGKQIDWLAGHDMNYLTESERDIAEGLLCLLITLDDGLEKSDTVVVKRYIPCQTKK